MHLGIDLMGADVSPFVLFKGLILAACEFPKLSFTVFVTSEIEKTLQDEVNQFSISFHTVNQVVSMRDSPSHALRKKSQSSLAVGIQLLKEKGVDAFITAGNTGALISTCRLAFKGDLFSNQPGLLVTFPTYLGEVVLIDVGGSLTLGPNSILKNASIGSRYYQWAFGTKRPTVGLLNIGEEPQKGSVNLRESFQLLKNHLGESFVGNVEPREVFSKKSDVVVSDGIVGNIFLKTAEGFANMITRELDQLNIDPPLKKQINGLQKMLAMDNYPGALVSGLPQIVIKCHGDSTPNMLKNSIFQAIRYVEGNLIANILPKSSDSTASS